MIEVLKSSNNLEVQKKNNLIELPRFKAMQSAFTFLNNNDFGRMKLFLVDGAVVLGNETALHGAMQEFATNMKEIVSSFFTLAKQVSISVDYRHLIKMINRDFKHYSRDDVLLVFKVIEKFTKESLELNAAELKAVCKKIDFDANCLDAFVASIDRISGEFNLHREVLDRFLNENSAFLTLKGNERHITSVAHYLFYNSRPADPTLNRKMIRCSKKYEMMLTEKISRLSVDDAASELAVRLYWGLKDSAVKEANNVRAEVMKLRDEFRKGLEERNEAYDSEDEAMFIESNDGFIREYLVFLVKAEITIPNKEDPIYCNLSCPSIVFDLSDNVSFRNQEEMKNRLLERFRGSSKVVESLNNGDGKLLLRVVSSVLRNVQMPMHLIGALKKRISGSEDADLPVGKFVKHFNPLLSNVKMLHRLGVKIAERSAMDASRSDKRPNSSVAWHAELLRLIVEGSSDEKIIEAVSEFRTEIVKASNVESFTESIPLDIKYPEKFLLLPYRHKVRILKCLRENGVIVQAENLMNRAIADTDGRLIRYLIKNYEMILPHHSIVEARRVELSLSSYQVFRKILTDTYKDSPKNASYLFVMSNFLLYQAESLPFEEYRTFIADLGKEMNPVLLECRNKAGSTHAMCIAERFGDRFLDYWKNDLTQKNREYFLANRTNADVTLSVFIAVHASKVFQEYWTNYVSEEEKELHCLTLNNKNKSLGMYVAEFVPEFCKEFYDKLPFAGRDAFFVSLDHQDMSFAMYLAKYVPGAFKSVWDRLMLGAKRKCFEKYDISNMSLAKYVAEFVPDFFKEFYLQEMPEWQRSEHIGRYDLNGMPLVFYVAKYVPDFFPELWTKRLTAEQRKDVAIEPSAEATLSMLVAEHNPKFFPEYWEKWTIPRNKKVHISKCNDSSETLVMYIAEFLPDYLERFWTEYMNDESRKYCCSHVSHFDTTLSEVALIHNKGFFKKLWLNEMTQSDRDNHAKIFRYKFPTIFMRVLDSYPAFTEQLWNSLSPEVRKNQDNMMYEYDKLALIHLAERSHKMFPVIWKRLSDEEKLKHCSILDPNDMSLGMYVAKFVPEFLMEFIDSLPSNCQDIFNHQLDINKLSWSSYVAVYASDVFPEYWTKKLARRIRKKHSSTISGSRTVSDTRAVSNVSKPNDEALLRHFNGSLAMLVAKHVSGFYPKFWAPIPPETKKSLLATADRNWGLSMYVARYASESLENMWNEMSEYIIQTFQEKDAGEGQGLAKIVLENKPDFFPKLWRSFPSDVKQKLSTNPNAVDIMILVLQTNPNMFLEVWDSLLLEDVRFELVNRNPSQRNPVQRDTSSDLPLAMAVIKYHPKSFIAFFKGLDQEMRSVCVIKSNLEKTKTLATYLIESNVKDFGAFWDMLLPIEKGTIFEKISRNGVDSINHIISFCPRGFDAMWTDKSLPSEGRDAFIKNLGINVAKLLVAASRKCPESIESIWKIIPNRVKLERNFYEVSYNDRSLADLIKSDSIAKKIGSVIKRSYEVVVKSSATASATVKPVDTAKSAISSR